ncbi:MAG: sigma-70 family RNA polymerase sigma factor [Candidatus Symbiothrix sp.]|jgi:RNA polymerase sigma factor (sigma-70 family)|nr:sigma-70 family RNA polymerase sigma factor [Candidatus Symbiothrix sp.]
MKTTVAIQQFENLYRTYRRQFTAYAHHRYGIEMEVATDIFQESIVAFYEKIHLGHLTAKDFTAPMRTYLFAIGKNLIFNYLRQQRKKEVKPEHEDFFEQITSDVFANPSHAEEIFPQSISNEAVKRLDDLCYRVLIAHYVQHLDMATIAREMGFSSAKRASYRHIICMERLKKNMLDIQTKKGKTYEKDTNISRTYRQ